MTNQLFTSISKQTNNEASSVISQEDAEKIVQLMDINNCTNCTNCIDCFNCTDCNNCFDCTNCNNCTNCTNCMYCRHCTDCNTCTYCIDCTNCNNCTDCEYCESCNNILKWTSSKEEGIAFNLRVYQNDIFPVTISSTHMQIGCQHYSHEFWEKAPTYSINNMAGKDISETWDIYKPILLAICKEEQNKVNNKKAANVQ